MELIVNEVIDYVQQSHINSNLVDWGKIIKAKNNIKTKKALGDFLDKYLLEKLQDNNLSNFKITDKNKIFSSSYVHKYAKSQFKKYYAKPQNYFAETPDIKIFENHNILYVNAPRTTNPDYWVQYFKILNTVLKNYKQYAGIIFDLSECLGGNYAPVIAPFHQIFGRTIIAHGYNKNSESNCFTHILKRGIMGEPDSWIKRVPFNPKKISDNRTSPVKIAVIVSAYTGSAGEFAGLFFKGRPGVKIIGEKTAGMCIWQNVHYLESDEKSFLQISSAFPIDRNGKAYDRKFYVEPDIKTSNPITKAIEFINSKT